jgi:hypothetical protein
MQYCTPQLMGAQQWMRLSMVFAYAEFNNERNHQYNRSIL